MGFNKTMQRSAHIYATLKTQRGNVFVFLAKDLTGHEPVNPLTSGKSFAKWEKPITFCPSVIQNTHVTGARAHTLIC